MRKLCLLLALATPIFAQTLNTASLSGKYYARHVEFSASDARSVAGTVNYDGAGHYAFNGVQVIGTGTPAAFSVNGTYAMSGAGLVTMSNPQSPALTINARYSTEALTGASTEATDNTFDMFVAIPAPVSTVNSASVKANFYAADLELTGALTSQVRDSIVSMTLDGAGNIATATANGHAANLNAGAVLSQAATGSYSVNGDGTGTMTFAGASLLNTAQRILYVSSSGNVIMGATPGAHDILIGVRAFTGAGTNTSLAPSFWLGGLRVDSGGYSDSYAGSGETINGALVTTTERLHETGLAGGLNLTESDSYTVAADGTGSYGAAKIALGTNGKLMVAAHLNAQLDPTGYEIAFAAQNPAQAGTGTFINPRGVVDAASAAPGVDAISPGEFIAIYGSGLAVATVSALPPYPASVGGVSVMIGGKPAPVYFVSTGQIDCLVPYGVTGTSVAITVTNGAAVSNTVTVPLASTSPGIFSQDATGTGDGAITHLDATLVNAASPAKKGEVVVVYMTGLGAVQTPITDGHGATAADSATTQLEVLVNGVPVSASDLLYAGLSSLPGLYQINFRVPANLTVSGELPLAVLTPEAFHDQVNIAVQ